MVFDLATETQVRAAQIFTGATMAAFIAAPMFRRQARTVRLAVTTLYIVGVVGFAIYALT
jgi:hypothetical protein